MPRGRVSLIGPRRRAVQWGAALLVAVLPFGQWHGRALLRFDLPGLALELAGQRFRIEELYLLWLALLGAIFLFLLLTITLGRVWCGWACPQTALCDLADSIERRGWPPTLVVLLHLGLGLWAGATVVWYFVSPYEFARRLSQAGHPGFWPSLTMASVALLTMANLTLIRRLFCQAFCPYGRFQTIIGDRATLTIQAPAGELPRCLDCKSCLRACPTGIDIRAGLQIECINCARCLDACRQVMARRGQGGIIRYTFGLEDLGWRAILGPKTLALGLLTLAVAAAVLFLAHERPAATFKLGRALLASRVTDDGRQRTFFRGALVNLGQSRGEFTLTLHSSKETDLGIKGPTHFSLAGNERRDITLAVDSPAVTGPDPVPITFILQADQDGSHITIDAFLTSADTTNPHHP